MRCVGSDSKMILSAPLLFLMKLKENHLLLSPLVGKGKDGLVSDPSQTPSPGLYIFSL